MRDSWKSVACAAWKKRALENSIGFGDRFQLSLFVQHFASSGLIATRSTRMQNRSRWIDRTFQMPLNTWQIHSLHHDIIEIAICTLNTVLESSYAVVQIGNFWSFPNWLINWFSEIRNSWNFFKWEIFGIVKLTNF